MLVSAVAFGAGALCLYYGSRDLRTRRALRRLKGRRGARPERDTRSDAPSERADPPAWTDTSIERSTGRGTPGADVVDPPGDPAEDVAIERGFVLLALGGLCLLFGILAL
ncbi:hypothetical protein [Halobellus rarus]|uniref:Uncharacterized protein n=1 Tax=Halobellus rarus TaxID=1126237 RepID=A0ABD6CMK9_9EURY|nr:hypothetical protein [Halobellus rarus]